MIDVGLLVVYVHILAWVFWLGADVGVFILGKYAQNPAHSVEQRLLLLQVAMLIDKFPRVSMVISLATGFYLSLASGWLNLPTVISAAIWLMMAFWFFVIVVRVRAEQAPHWVELSEKIIYYAILFLIGAAVGATLMGATIVAASWLFAKLGLIAIVLVMVLWLEKAFQPAVVGFMQLATDGSSPELEGRIRGAMDTTYASVIGIYVCTLLAGLFGVLKPALW
ncbi:MAG: hypothetical protein AAF270_13755 [Pseudomonadota bacterium]